MATKKVDLKSDEVRELLGTSPAWLVRWGSALLLLILLVFLVLAFLIRYPVSTQFPASVQNSGSTTPVLAIKDGTIKFWLVENGSMVDTNQALALQTNQADYNHVLALQERLDRFDIDNPNSFKDFGDLDDLELGALKRPLEAFRKSLLPVKVSTGTSRKDINFKKKQSKALSKLVKDLEKQLPEKKNAAIAWERSFLEARAAYSSGNIDLEELQRIQDFSRKADASLADLETEIAKRKKDLKKVNQELDQSSSGTSVKPPDKSEISEALDSLQLAIETWLKGHLIYAPLTGTIQFDMDQEATYNIGDSIAQILTQAGNTLILKGNAEIPGGFTKETLLLDLIRGNGEISPVPFDDITIEHESDNEYVITILINNPGVALIEEVRNKEIPLKLTYGEESFLKRLWKDFGRLD